jgi:hypothetical protein
MSLRLILTVSFSLHAGLSRDLVSIYNFVKHFSSPFTLLYSMLVDLIVLMMCGEEYTP